MIDRIRFVLLSFARASALIALRSGVEPLEPWLSRLQPAAAGRSAAGA